MDFKTTKNKIQKILEDIRQLNLKTEDYENTTVNIPKKNRNLISKKTKVLYDSDWLQASISGYNTEYVKNELSVTNANFAGEAEIDIPDRYIPYVNSAIIFKMQADPESPGVPNTKLVAYDKSVVQSVIENIELNADNDLIYSGIQKEIGGDSFSGSKPNYVAQSEIDNGTIKESHTKTILYGTLTDTDGWSYQGEIVGVKHSIDANETVLANYSTTLYNSTADNYDEISEVTDSSVSFIGRKIISSPYSVVERVSGSYSYVLGDEVYLFGKKFKEGETPSYGNQTISAVNIAEVSVSENLRLYYTSDTRFPVSFEIFGVDEFDNNYWQPLIASLPYDTGSYSAPSSITYNKSSELSERNFSLTKRTETNKSLVKLLDVPNGNSTYLFKQEGNAVLQSQASEQIGTTDKSKYNDVYTFNVGSQLYSLSESHSLTEHPYYSGLKDICFYKYLITANPELNYYEDRPTKK